MCGNCFTTFDAAAVQSAGAAALAYQGMVRVRDHLAGRHPALRRQARWDRTAMFLRELDLDPDAVLGPRPMLPVGVRVHIDLRSPAASTTGAAAPA